MELDQADLGRSGVAICEFKPMSPSECRKTSIYCFALGVVLIS